MSYGADEVHKMAEFLYQTQVIRLELHYHKIIPKNVCKIIAEFATEVFNSQCLAKVGFSTFSKNLPKIEVCLEEFGGTSNHSGLLKSF